ncbi:hypothetical protein SPI_04210 [Niveomyces insectorum RCEF 264]|uniref:Uncharacterized protein n=1 Tax=Niveomyces insectorum RCEF 264 TaxID=1081102 RepID=A0A167VIV2_9HYPO|nr:hypothetical protein SPI_04210 [Niveomyces insectorum RCEF 264]
MVSLPVESSWRMVEGENDSFDTSVVPNDELQQNLFSSSGEYTSNNSKKSTNDEDPFFLGGASPPPTSSQPSWTAKERLGAGGTGTGTGTGAGAGGGGSFGSSIGNSNGSLAGTSPGNSQGNSQDDDLHAFLRKAADDERVLLRSPFQPSVPSSVRQSPLSSARNSAQPTRQTTLTAAAAAAAVAPALRMPMLDRDGSSPQHSLASPRNDNTTNTAQQPGSLRQRTAFRVSATGSPGRRRPTGPSATGVSPVLSPVAAWRRGRLVDLSQWSAGRLLLGLVLVVACGAAVQRAGPRLQRQDLTSAGGPTTLCRIPGAAWLRLSACTPTDSTATSVPVVVQATGGDGGTEPHVEIDHSRIPPSRIYNNNNNDDDDDDDHKQDHEQAAAGLRRQQRDDDARGAGHTNSLVRNAAELMRVQIHLATIVRDYIMPRSRQGSRSSRSSRASSSSSDDAQSDDTMGPLAAQDAWRVPRARTKALRADVALRAAHEAAVQRAATAVDELAAVRDAVVVLQEALGGTASGSSTSGDDNDNDNDYSDDDSDLDVRRHMDIVEAGLEDLAAVGQ